jgi:NAD(P)-dependent dehydrogenase (short-subunit alcohol dehydrogenase family)
MWWLLLLLVITVVAIVLVIKVRTIKSKTVQKLNVVFEPHDDLYMVPGYDLNRFKRRFSKDELETDLNKPVGQEHILYPDKLILKPDPPAHTFDYPPKPTNPLSLENKTVLVVGASKGIGKATYDRFIQEGCTVIGTSRYPERYFNPKFPNQKLIKMDIRDTQSTAEAFDEIKKITSKIDILILCPGIHWAGSLQDTQGDELSDIFNLIVSGYQRCVYNALPLMRNKNHENHKNQTDQKDTRIISLGSLAGEFGIGLGGYSIAKRGLQHWNDIHQQEAMLRLAHGKSTNEPTFTLIEPGFVLTTIGLLETYNPGSPSGAGVPEGNSVSNEINENIRADRYQTAYQQNVKANISTDIVAEAIYRVATSPQPTTRYAGQPNSTKLIDSFWSPTYGQAISKLNSGSPSDQLNEKMKVLANLSIHTPEYQKAIRESIFKTKT